MGLFTQLCHYIGLRTVYKPFLRKSSQRLTYILAAKACMKERIHILQINICCIYCTFNQPTIKEANSTEVDLVILKLNLYAVRNTRLHTITAPRVKQPDNFKTLVWIFLQLRFAILKWIETNLWGLIVDRSIKWAKVGITENWSTRQISPTFSRRLIPWSWSKIKKSGPR